MSKTMTSLLRMCQNHVLLLLRFLARCIVLTSLFLIPTVMVQLAIAAEVMPVARPHGTASEIGRLTGFAPEGYVGSSRCANCHATENEAWASSHHAHAMDRATSQTVLGDFSGVSATHFSSSARFWRDGERFLVETEDADGQPATFEISDTFGITPLQQYLVRFPDGRRQPLPWAWDSRPKAEGGQHWIHVYKDDVPANDPLHWTGVLQTWNHMCAECHSTALQKGYDLDKDSYQTTFSEISVGCESCHGPGAGHLAWAEKKPHSDTPLKGFSSTVTVRGPVDWTPDPETGSPTASVLHPDGDEVELCARCHARRGQISEDWQPGQPLTQTHLPAFLSADLFEADGQMLDEVFNDHAFKQSKMYAKGVVCSDCHNPHSGALKAPGAQVCAQCHLPEKFETTTHSGHPIGPGMPDCISCHMPERTYMRVDARHDHSFRIPRPDLSASIGTPNSCNSCHTDRTPGWAANAVQNWHGAPAKGFQTYSETFHEARQGDPAARAKLIALAKAPEAPAIARATALEELARFPSIATLQAITKGLKGTDPQMRIGALHALAGAPQRERLSLAGSLLEDPVLAVRSSAAQLLSDVQPDTLPAEERKRLQSALTAHEAELRLNADRPEGRANYASYLINRGDRTGAERQLRAGLKQAPGFAALSVNLADLVRQNGDEAAAEAILREGITNTTAPAPLHHALGLSLVRQKRMPEAAAELRLAHDLAPENTHYAYVFAVLLQSMGNQTQSSAVVAKALERNPFDPELLALALNEAMGRREEESVLKYATRLSALRPEDVQITRLIRYLNDLNNKNNNNRN